MGRSVRESLQIALDTIRRYCDKKGFGTLTATQAAQCEGRGADDGCRALFDTFDMQSGDKPIRLCEVAAATGLNEREEPKAAHILLGNLRAVVKAAGLGEPSGECPLLIGAKHPRTALDVLRALAGIPAKPKAETEVTQITAVRPKKKKKHP